MPLPSANTVPSALYVVSLNTDFAAFFTADGWAMHCVQPVIIITINVIMCFILIYVYDIFSNSFALLIAASVTSEPLSICAISSILSFDDSMRMRLIVPSGPSSLYTL